MADDLKPKVSTDRGRVFIDGWTFCEGFHPYTVEGRIVNHVRERTPHDWWRWAYEVDRAGQVEDTGGPCGTGVDFFAWDFDVLLAPDARSAIEQDAAEAAREVIIAALDEHLVSMWKALVNV